MLLFLLLLVADAVAVLVAVAVPDGGGGGGGCRYSLCPFMVANAPLVTFQERFNDIMGKGAHGSQSWGLPPEKWVLVLPWWGCDFNCKNDSSCHVLQGPLKYRHNTPTDPAAPVDATPGYAL